MASDSPTLEDRVRRRRGYAFGLQAVLFLPAQGVWLALALAYGSLWWAAWALALAAVIGAYVLLVVQDRRRDPATSPTLLTLPLAMEGAVIVAGLVVRLLV